MLRPTPVSISHNVFYLNCFFRVLTVVCSWVLPGLAAWHCLVWGRFLRSFWWAAQGLGHFCTFQLDLMALVAICSHCLNCICCYMWFYMLLCLLQKFCISGVVLYSVYGVVCRFWNGVHRLRFLCLYLLF